MTVLGRAWVKGDGGSLEEGGMDRLELVKLMVI